MSRAVRRGLVTGPLGALALGLVLFAFAPVRADDVESEWDSIVLLDQDREPDEKAPRKRRSSKKARSRRSATGPGYRDMQKGWHAPPDDAAFALVTGADEPPLVLRTVGMREPFVLALEDGHFGQSAVERADEAFRSWDGGPHVHPRLLALIYRATRHFDVPYVHLVSGIRRDRGGSRHSHGLAADVVLPGVSDEESAAFFRAQGFAGVGTYTRAGFVHVDVREQSYFWIDRSPPGKRWKVNQVRADEAKAADAEARARGEEAFVEPPALAHALERRAAARRSKKSKKRKTAGR